MKLSPSCRRLILLTAVAACFLSSAAPAGARELSKTRWRERAYGISLRPPVGTKMLQQTADQLLLRIADQEGAFTMSVDVKHARKPLKLKEVIGAAQRQMFRAQPVTEVLEIKIRKIAGRPGAVLYFRVPQADGHDALVAQALIHFAKKRIAVIDLKTPFKRREDFRPMFEAVLDTVKIVDPDVLNQRREAALERGRQWRRGLTLEQIHEALREEYYYRLIESGKDIGYIHVREYQTHAKGKPGVAIDVRSWIHLDKWTIHSVAHYFLSDDATRELWTIKTTRWPRGASSSSTRSRTFTETGVRAGDRITVTIAGPAGHQVHKYTKPEVSYLSQVEARLMPRLLPVNHPATYAFYWYNSSKGAVTLRTDRVTPMLTGYTITTRPTPNAPAQTSAYTGDGRLREKRLPGDRKLIPADEQMIRKLWQE